MPQVKGMIQNRQLLLEKALIRKNAYQKQHQGHCTYKCFTIILAGEEVASAKWKANNFCLILDAENLVIF